MQAGGCCGIEPSRWRRKIGILPAGGVRDASVCTGTAGMRHGRTRFDGGCGAVFAIPGYLFRRRSLPRYGAPAWAAHARRASARGASGNTAKTLFTGSIGCKRDENERLSGTVIPDQRTYRNAAQQVGGATPAHTGAKSVRTSGAVSVPAAVATGPGGGTPSQRHSLNGIADRACGYLLGVPHEKPDNALHGGVDLSFGCRTRSCSATKLRRHTQLLHHDPGLDDAGFPQRRGQGQAGLRLCPLCALDGFHHPGAGARDRHCPRPEGLTDTLGVGRRRNETWSGPVRRWHDAGTGNPTSRLGPAGKRNAVRLGASRHTTP